MLTESQIAIVSVFTHGLLYGIYLATLIQCFRWLIFTDEGWKPRERINSVMTLTTILIFLMSTVNHATSLTSDLKVYIRGDMSMYHGTGIMTNISENLAIISIDAVLIYRCWVVYAKSWRVICVPVIVWLASLACSVLQSYNAAAPHLKGQAHSQGITVNALTGLYACNIAITIYTTSAIIYRILSSRTNSGGKCNHKRLNYTMRILAESGVLYTSMMIFSLVGASFNGRAGQTWVKVLISSISDTMAFSTGGISFNLMHIRVYQSRVELYDSSADSRDDYGLSGNQFNDLQITALSEGPLSNVLKEVVDEIQEHRRSKEGMHD